MNLAELKTTLKEAWNAPGTKAILLFGLTTCLALVMAFTYKESAIEHCKYICDIQCATLSYADGYTCTCVSESTTSGFNHLAANKTLIGGNWYCNANTSFALPAPNSQSEGWYYSNQTKGELYPTTNP